MQNALKGVNSQIKNTQSQLKDVEKLLKLDPGNTELLTQKQKLLNDAVSETKDKLTTLKTAAEQANTALANGDISQEQYDALQREIIETEQRLKELETQAGQSSVALQKLAAAGDKLKSVGDKTSSVGTSLTKNVTAPLAAVGAASVAAFNEVDAGLDIVVQKTGATGDALTEMQDIVKDLATEIPTDFETAGAAVGEVNTRFGLTGQALDDLSAKFIKFAALNDTDVSASVDNVSSVLNAFGLDTEDASGMLDVLNSVGQSTGLTMDELSNRMSSNAAQLQELGLNATESAQFLGMVEMAGMDTSAAMMGLKTAMKTATADGLTLEQAMAGFTETMNGNASETEKLQAAYDLFGTRAGASLYNAFANGKISMDEFASSMSDFSGNVETTFENAMDPIDSFQTSLNEIKVVGAELGATLIEALKPALDTVAAAVEKFSEWWSSLSPEMQSLIVKIALVVAALGPVLVIVGKVISAVGTILTILPKIGPAITAVKTAFAALNAVMAANPIILIIAAVAALVAAFIYLWNNCEGFREFFINLWESIKTAAINAWNAVTTFLTNAWNNIKATATAIWTGITSTITGIKDSIVNGFNEAISFITSLPSKALQWGKDIIAGIVQGIKDKIEAVKTAVSGVAGTISSFLHFSVPDEGPLTSFESWMPDFMSGLAKGIEESRGLVQKAISGVSSDLILNPSVGAITTASASTGVSKVQHTGTIRVEGVNDEGMLSGVVDIVIEKLRQEVRA